MANRRGNCENSIFQHNGRWFVQGYIHGRRTKVSRVKRADAVAAWDAKVKAAAPGRTPNGPRTVSEAAEEWFVLREGDWKYSTRVNFRTALDKQVLPHLGTIRVEGLTPRRVEQWQDDLRRSGLAASTVRQARIVLSGVYTMLLRHERVNSNPVKSVPAPQEEGPRRRPPFSGGEPSGDRGSRQRAGPRPRAPGTNPRTATGRGPRPALE